MRGLVKVLSVLFVVSVLFPSFISAQEKQNLDPFPQAPEGMVRHVIELKKKSDESLFKIELIPGKVMSVDCNKHTLQGKLTEKDVQGWGYTYYEFESNGQTMSTMMACNKPNENRFISSQTIIVRYNSKLPIVVYTPVGYDVKYRIWKAEKEKSSVIK